MSSAGFTPRIAETRRMTDTRAFRPAAGPRGFHALSATHASADPLSTTVSGDGRAPSSIPDAAQGTPATGAPAAAGGAVDRAVAEVSRRAGAAMVIARVADVAADPVPLVACRGT
jgi:hypothetical protein